MARIKLNLPQKFIYETQIRIRITDLNYGGHLGNDSLLSVIHEARARFLASYGQTEKDMYGVSLIMSDTAIQYKSEAFFGEVLIVRVAAQDFSNKGFDLFFSIINQADGSEVARAKTGMVCFDYEKKKVVALPGEAFEKWAGK